MFSKNRSRNDAGTHRHPKKGLITMMWEWFWERVLFGWWWCVPASLRERFVKKFLMGFFFRVAVRSRIVVGTVFGEHDFLIMSVELVPGIAIESRSTRRTIDHVQLPRARASPEIARHTPERSAQTPGRSKTGKRCHRGLEQSAPMNMRVENHGTARHHGMNHGITAIFEHGSEIESDRTQNGSA